MSIRLLINTEVETQELIDDMITSLTHDQLFEFVKQLDEQVQEWYFSEKLIAYGKELEAKRDAEKETPCVDREDGTHCNCWYDGGMCCACGKGVRWR